MLSLFSQSLSPPATSDFWYGMLGQRTAAGIDVTHDVAMTYSAVWACTRVLSASGSSLPFNLHRRVGNRTEIAYDHPVQRILHDVPNDEMGSMGFRSIGIARQVNCGDFYSEIMRDPRGLPWKLEPIASDRAKPCRADDRMAREYNLIPGGLSWEVRRDDGTKDYLRDADIFHVRSIISDNGITGKGVIANARETIAHGIATVQQGAAYMKNSARPSVVISGLRIKDATDLETYRRMWGDVHGGAENNAKPAFTPEGSEVKVLSFSPEDSQFIQTLQHSVEDICRWYGVPPHMVQHLLRATFCLPGDALVMCEAGPKPISNVSVGELVWSRDGDKWVLSPVEKSECTGVDEILKIRAGIRTLRCNARHRVPVRRKTLVPFTGGRGQCIVVDGQKFRTSYAVEWIPAGEIRLGDQLLAAHGLGAATTRSCPTRKECSIEFMESLGMIVGDGFFARTEKKTKGKTTSYKSTFGLSHGENDSYLPHYVAAIESEFRSCDGPYGMTNGGTATLKSKRRDKNTTVFYSSVAYAEIEAIGITGLAKTKRVPAWIFDLDEDLKLAFLRGYLDSDGTVTKSGCVKYHSVNKTLLEQVRHLCMSIGIRVANIYQADIDSEFNGKKYTHRLYSFLVTNPSDGQRIGTHTDFYKPRMSAAVVRSERGGRTCKVHPYESRKRAIEDGVMYTTVEEITTEPIAVPVYDLTVAGTHTFVADGVLVHNSNIEHQGIDFVVYSLLPWLKLWEEEVYRKLLTPIEQQTYYAKHNVTALLRGDSAARAAFYEAMWRISVFSTNDILELEDMNPIEGGDQHFVQTSYTTIDKLSIGEWKDARAKNDVSRDEFRAKVLQLEPSTDKGDAPLLALVGGLTGSIDVARAVGTGELSAEAGTEILKLFLQIEQEKAAAIAGEKQEQPEPSVVTGPPMIEQEPEAKPEDDGELAAKIAALIEYVKPPESIEPRIAAIQEAARLMVEETSRRMLTKEISAIERACSKEPKEFFLWLDTFYDEHSVKLADSLSLPSRALSTAHGKPMATDLLAINIAEDQIRRSRESVLELTTCQPDEWPQLGERFATLAAAWRETRAKQVIEFIEQGIPK